MIEPTQAGAGKRRVTGVDAARGAALVGMMAIHILPGWNENYEPTLSWSILAGRGAALFAVLAGVSLAFMSGGSSRLSGRNLAGARYGLAVRAVCITVIGLLLGYLATPAHVILVYYGVMFLLALPLLRMSASALFLAAACTAVVAPFLMQATRDSLPDMNGVEPTFSTLLAAPGDVVAQILLTGTYPALPWMAYVCVGLAIGRLNLTAQLVQFRLLVAGVCLAAGSAILSALLLGPFGGLERLEEAASVWSYSPEEVVNDILVWGPDPTLPTDTLWWLASLAPYSSTPLALLNTIGTAMAFLGLILLLSKVGSHVLAPLALVGKMTLTLYSLHLLLLATGVLEDQPVANLILQLLAVLVFAYVWMRFAAQGPLERMVAEGSKWVRNKYLARTAEPPTGSRSPAEGTHGRADLLPQNAPDTALPSMDEPAAGSVPPPPDSGDPQEQTDRPTRRRS